MPKRDTRDKIDKRDKRDKRDIESGALTSYRD